MVNFLLLPPPPAHLYDHSEGGWGVSARLLNAAETPRLGRLLSPSNPFVFWPRKGAVGTKRANEAGSPPPSPSGGEGRCLFSLSSVIARLKSLSRRGGEGS